MEKWLSLKENEHIYVVMEIICDDEKKVTIYMKGYTEEGIEEFSEERKIQSNIPVAIHLFGVDEECERLDKK